MTYIGVHTKDGQLEKNVLREVYKRAGITTEAYPPGVYIDWRDGFWVGVNYSSSQADISLPENAEIILGSRHLKPAEVILWK